MAETCTSGAIACVKLDSFSLCIYKTYRIVFDLIVYVFVRNWW